MPEAEIWRAFGGCGRAVLTKRCRFAPALFATRGSLLCLNTRDGNRKSRGSGGGSRAVGGRQDGDREPGGGECGRRATGRKGGSGTIHESQGPRDERRTGVGERGPIESPMIV